MTEEANHPASEVKPGWGGIAVGIAERVLVESRWLLVLMYLGLIVAMLVYCVNFMVQLGHLVAGTFSKSESEVMIAVLGLVDISMIANLIQMIVLGGMTIFVKPIAFHDPASRPGWLKHINSGTLKVKMALSLVGVTAIHLLKDFVSEEVNWNLFWMRLLTHLAFVASAVALAWVDRVLHPNADKDQHS